MQRTNYYIGIDISAEDFSASCITNPDNLVFPTDKFQNVFEGFDKFLSVVNKHKINCKVEFQKKMLPCKNRLQSR